jgi:hypothetical protein
VAAAVLVPPLGVIFLGAVRLAAPDQRVATAKLQARLTVAMAAALRVALGALEAPVGLSAVAVAVAPVVLLFSGKG